jgi:hypothetical protein
MGGSTPSTQTTISKTELPAWLEDVTKANIAKATEVADRPYVPYSGNLTAGFAPEEESAFSYAMSNVGREDPAYFSAARTAADVSGYTPGTVSAQNFLQGDIGAYMNPYIQNVEDRAIANAQRSAQININELGSKAARAGAFGGSRLGVSEGVAASEAARDLGDLSAKLRADAFTSASGLMTKDMDRALTADTTNVESGLTGAGLNLKAADTLGSIADRSLGARLADTGVMTAVGEERRAMAQRLLDEEYARFLEERNAPIEGLNLRLAATSATPYGETKTQTGPGPQGPNALMTGLGAAASVASIIGAL